VVVIAALYFAREILIPITLAILLSFLLVPIVELLRRARFGRVPAVLLAVIMALSVILGFGGAIGSQVAQLATNIPQYAVTIEKKVDTVRAYTVGRIATASVTNTRPWIPAKSHPEPAPPQRAARPGPPRKLHRPRPVRLRLRPWRSSNVISRRRCRLW
jgi:predicted PurR-regulated permease PerM